MTPGIYEHYKKKLYRVYFVAEDAETEEKMVVYSPMDNPEQYYVRKLDHFLQNVQVEEEEIPRFKFVSKEH